MEASSPYGFVQKDVGVENYAVEAVDADDDIPPSTPLLVYIKRRLLGLIWRWVYWWYGLFTSPYVYVYHTAVDAFYRTVVPIISPPMSFMYKNRIAVLKYSLYIFLFVSTTMWMATIMFLYTRSFLLLKEHSYSPLYFDFNQSTPGAEVLFSADSLSYGQLYSAYVDMELPESPNNIDLGMFMITLDLYSDNNNTLIWHTSRPGILRYKTWVLRLVKTITYSMPSIVGWYEEKQSLHIEMANDIIPAVKSWYQVKAVVTISKPQIEIYSASVHIQASLSWFSYFLHNYPILSFIVSMPFLLVINGSALFLIVASMYLNERLALAKPQRGSEDTSTYEELQPIINRAKQDGRASFFRKHLIVEEPPRPVDEEEILYNRFMSDEEDLTEVRGPDGKGKKKVTFEEGTDYLAESSSEDSGEWVDVPEDDPDASSSSIF